MAPMPERSLLRLAFYSPLVPIAVMQYNVLMSRDEASYSGNWTRVHLFIARRLHRFIAPATWWVRGWSETVRNGHERISPAHTSTGPDAHDAAPSSGDYDPRLAWSNQRGIEHPVRAARSRIS